MDLKIQLITLLALLFVGCNQTKENNLLKENNDKFREDSISKVIAKQEKIEKAKLDSIVTLEQEKVIGTIEFGMEESIVKLKIKEFKEENKRPYKIMDKTFYNYYIGNFEISFIRDSYHNDKLYKIKIIGKPILWENFDSEAPIRINEISNVLKAKYGNPNLHYDLEPRYKLQKNHTYLIDSWSIGNKEIQVRISDQGTSYTVNLIITKPEIEKLILKEQKVKENQETLKGTEVF